MSSVSSVSSSASSIYGNRNIFTGLASGMDTEAMIENSVLGIKTKIQSLIQKQTKITWQQDAIRSITDKLAALSEKYTSYTSTTNLNSMGFFTGSIITSPQGANASKVTATGKSTSDIEINAIKSLATSSRYSIDIGNLDFADSVLRNETDTINWTSSFDVSTVDGSITLQYNTEYVTLDFKKNEVFHNVSDLAGAIRDKLSDSGYGDKIDVSTNGNTINFVDKANSGTTVSINKADGNLRTTLGIGSTSIQLSSNNALYKYQNFADYVEGRTVNVTLDGVTKTITLGAVTGSNTAEQVCSMLQSGIDKAFGTGKLNVSLSDDGKKLSFEAAANSGSSFYVSSEIGSALGMGEYGISNYMNSQRTLGDMLGSSYFTKNGKFMTAEGNYALDPKTGKYLDSAGNAVDKDGYRLDSSGNRMKGVDLVINGVTVGTYSSDARFNDILADINNSDAGVTATYSKMTNKLVFTTKDTGKGTGIIFGNGTNSDGLAADLFTVQKPNLSDNGTLLDADGNRVTGSATTSDGTTTTTYEYNIRRSDNGKYYRVNRNGDYIDRDGNVVSESLKVEETDKALIKQGILPDMSNYTRGTDAELTVTVNGEEVQMRRSSNTIDMDGMSVTLKGTFGYNEIKDANGNVTELKRDENAEAITFNTEADADKIVDVVKSFVESFNAIMKETHDAFATLPEKKTGSKRSNYEPLTDEDKEDMTEAEIARYEEKAKIGILFGDNDLRSLYNALRDAITPGGESRKLMESIGLTTEYSGGVTTLKLNEDKLRAALASDPEQVQKVFSRTTENGAKTEGLMPALKKSLDKYASLSIASPGVLVKKAGTKLSPLSLSNNLWQDKLNSLDTQIDKWQTKMSKQIDRYTKLFTKMEQLIAQMNSQSSALAGLTTGGDY